MVLCVGVNRGLKCRWQVECLKISSELKLGLRKLWGCDWLRVHDVKQSPPAWHFTTLRPITQICEVYTCIETLQHATIRRSRSLVRRRLPSRARDSTWQSHLLRPHCHAHRLSYVVMYIHRTSRDITADCFSIAAERPRSVTSASQVSQSHY